MCRDTLDGVSDTLSGVLNMMESVSDTVKSVSDRQRGAARRAAGALLPPPPLVANREGRPSLVQEVKGSIPGGGSILLFFVY